MGEIKALFAAEVTLRTAACHNKCNTEYYRLVIMISPFPLLYLDISSV